MSFERIIDVAHEDYAIKAKKLTKWYEIKRSPTSVFFRNFLDWGKATRLQLNHARGDAGKIIALHPIDFAIHKGSVIGIIGKNGAGKSTLLQLVCGTIHPSEGTINVNGRISALLELGAGFNPEFTGIENARLNAALQGMSSIEIENRLAEIIAFADIGDFVERPTKTYSSGMFVRLAFAVATCIDPDILIIDEALSVGDGQFAKKSFEKIMTLKEKGATILFCSHSLYQVEALCDRVLWLDKGTLRFDGRPSDAIAAYSYFLESEKNATARPPQSWVDASGGRHSSVPSDLRRGDDPFRFNDSSMCLPRLAGVDVKLNGTEVDLGTLEGRRLIVNGTGHQLCFVIHIKIDVAELGQDTVDVISEPTVALTVTTPSGQCLSSVSTLMQPTRLYWDHNGYGVISLTFPNLPLRRGLFRFDVLLGCGQGIHLYDQAIGVLTLDVRSDAAEQGLVQLAHQWQ